MRRDGHSNLETEHKIQRHRSKIRGTGQTQKGPPSRETPGCPVGGRANYFSTPPPSCLGRDFRAGADSINGQAAADREAGPSESTCTSPPPGPCQTLPPHPGPPGGAGHELLRGAGLHMRSSDLWPAEGCSAWAEYRNLRVRILAPPPLCCVISGSRFLLSVRHIHPTS